MKQEFSKKDTLVVKGAAILCMLFYHLFENENLINGLHVDYRPLSLSNLLLISKFGNICVAVFALLSAYGITKSIQAWERTKQAEACFDKDAMQKMYGQAGRRFGKLVLNFLAMFVSINLLWCTKFNYKGLYGGGWQGGLYALLDALGFASMFDTPTINATWWYMELAILIIFMVPLLYLLVKNLGHYSLVLAVLLPVVVEMNYDVKRYYFVVLFGVVVAWGNWFEKLWKLRLPLALQAVLGVVAMGGCILFRQNYVVYNEFGYLVDAPVALFFAWFVATILGRIPGVRTGLAFLGKHSMNMYFVHTFFYMAIYQQFIYSFRYVPAILVALVVVSLLYSVVLEAAKRGILWVIYKIKG